jgi:beta-lactamase regulating signal transducer with metallopeptidase domain
MTASALVLQASLKGAIIFGIAAIAAFVLRNREASLRHQIWTGAIIAQLCLLALVPAMPRVSVPLLPRISWSFAQPASVSGDVTSGGAAVTNPDAHQPGGSDVAQKSIVLQNATVPAPNVGANTASDQSIVGKGAPASAPAKRIIFTPRNVIVSIWLAGMLVVLLRFMYGTIVMARLARHGERVEDGSWLALTQRTAKKLGILRPLTLLRGDTLTVPVTWGIIYPIVLLPADAAQWSEERRRFVLVHEMAHVKRFDALTQLVAQIAVAVFWFSPFVWLAEQRMRVEREHACDDVVLDEGTRPVTYADELLQMVRALGTRQRTSSAPAFAALAMARRSEFEGRMLAILDPSRPRSTNVRGVAFAAFALVVVAAPLAALSPFMAETPRSTASHSLASSPPSPSHAAAPSQPQGIAGRIAGAVADKTRSILSPSGSCEGENLKPGRSSTHVSIDDDASNFRASYLASTAARCVQGDMIGVVALSADETSVARLGDNASVFLREVSGTTDRSVKILPAANGALEYRYTVNDKRHDYDAGARAWVAAVLPEFARETAVNSRARMQSALSDGGVAGALNVVRRIHSTSSRRAHLADLFQLRGNPQRDSVIEAAGPLLKDSPSELTAFLRNVRAMQTPGRATSDAMETALRNITSDGDLHRTLDQMLPGADRQTLLMILDVARNIESDGDMTQLLSAAAPFVLTRRDDALRNAFFKAYETIESSGDQSVVLSAAIKFAHGNEPLTLSIIRGTHSIDASGSKAVVLTAVANNRLVTSKTLRDAFAVEAASPDLADGDRSVILAALLRNSGN